MVELLRAAVACDQDGLVQAGIRLKTDLQSHHHARFQPDFADSGSIFRILNSFLIWAPCRRRYLRAPALNKSELSKQAWAAEVSKMVNAQKAPGAPEDVASTVDDLTRVTGAKWDSAPSFLNQSWSAGKRHQSSLIE